VATTSVATRKILEHAPVFEDLSMTESVTAAVLRERLLSGNEIAVVDVREHGVYGTAHLLLASCAPLSRLEMMFGDLVPNLDAPVVLCDEGPVGNEKRARKAAEKLSALGYTRLEILEGGIEGWRDAGFELFSGVNVPSKAFGEYVEHEDDTPRITADDLIAKQKNGDPIVILDSRPMGEFNRMSIPGGIDCPGAELVYRVHEVAPDPDTEIIVNCAGRTRSIIGCQSLINAGLPNRINALKDGTMGWHLAGHKVATGVDTMAPMPQGEALEVAKQRASDVADRYEIPNISAQGIEDLRTSDATLYLLDVRSPDEFRAGHLAGTRSAPGGQLVQATDEYVAVRNSQIVLIDDHGVRATMTASWLVQMGWPSVHVHLIGDQPLVTDEVTNFLDFKPWETVSALELKAVLDTGEPVAVVDLGNSLEFRESHIPQAWWAVRSRLMSDLQFKPEMGMIVVTSPDGNLAHYAAPEIAQLKPQTIVRVLEGGTASWRAAGYAMEEGIEGDPSAKPDANPDELDVFYKPYDFTSAAERRMQEYLDWEVALVAQVERDGTVHFKRFA